MVKKHSQFVIMLAQILEMAIKLEEQGVELTGLEFANEIPFYLNEKLGNGKINIAFIEKVPTKTKQLH